MLGVYGGYRVYRFVVFIFIRVFGSRPAPGPGRRGAEPPWTRRAGGGHDGRRSAGMIDVGGLLGLPGLPVCSFYID